MEYQFLVNNEIKKIKIEPAELNQYFVEFEGKSLELQISTISPNCFSMLAGNRSVTTYFAQDQPKTYIFTQGGQFIIEKADSQARASRGQDQMEDELEIGAPMPGKILQILVAEGDSVKANQPLFIIESMKMENQVSSMTAGKVKKIFFKINDLVSTGDIVVELEKVS